MGKEKKFSWGSALVGAAVAGATALALSSKPRDPTFHLISIDLTSFKLNFPALDAETILTVHVTNPNVAPIHYSDTVMSIYYSGTLLGSAPVQAGSQPPHSCQLLRLPARLSGLQLAHHAKNFLADVARREMVLEATVDITGDAKVLWWNHGFKVKLSKNQKMAESRTVTVAALQFACTDDAPTNVDTAERLIRAAHKKGANIVLVQELFEGYYFCQAQREDFFQRAKPRNEHPTILRMQKLAKELGVVIPVSFFEEANTAHFNSVVVIDADGTDLGLYRKSHIPDGPGYQEKFYFNPGDTGFKVFQTKFAKIGVGICWDQWFPEAARAMALQGAEILFYPTAIGSEPQDQGLDSRDHWKRVMQGHAGANVVPLVASNRIGKEIIETEHGKSAITFYGNSFIAGPTGELIATADDKEEAVLVAEFDLDKIKSKRHGWGVFRDRRPDLYKVLLTLDGSNISL